MKLCSCRTYIKTRAHHNADSHIRRYRENRQFGGHSQEYMDVVRHVNMTAK